MAYSGPYETLTSRISPDPGSSSRIYYRRQKSYRTIRGSVRHPIPYLMETSDSWKKSGDGDAYGYPDCPNTRIASEGSNWNGIAGRLRAQALNQAYEKFVGKIKGETASLGTNLAERKEAVSMISNRALQLLAAARKIRKGDLRGLIPKKGSRRPTPKGLSGKWLEYHFGWEPMIKDIFTSVDILQGPFPYQKPVRARATLSAPGRSSNESSDTSSFYEWNQEVSVLLQGRYSVNNPNLFLANQLGLVNPVGLAWELVPFSFVVDWFTTVGAFLNAWSDFIGLEREDEFYSVLYKGSESFSHRYKPPYSHIPPWIAGANATKSERTLGMWYPTPMFKPLKGFSVTRGATAIALLVGFLKS